MTREFKPVGRLAAAASIAGLLCTPLLANAAHECGAEHGKVHAHGPLEGGCALVDPNGFIDGDARVDAPELAQRGPYKVGVRTKRVVNYDEIDILNWSEANPAPRYNRRLTVEIWYPADLRRGDEELTTYHDVLGSGPGDPERPLRPFEFPGRAARNAYPLVDDGPYPLVVVSHGYPGSRVLLTYLTENLASKGYVVVAIDHTDSTHADKIGFASTLLNRTLDINRVISNMDGRGRHPRSFLRGMVDAGNTAVIGYSMGGYGVLNASGAGYTEAAVGYSWAVPGGYLSRLQTGTAEYEATIDSRIRAMVAFAPWGGQFGFWDAQGLAGITMPSLFIAGAQDQTSDFNAINFLFENAINSDRYFLIYESAIHEVAVNPPPPLAAQYYREFIHYQEPAWDNRRLNNINQHFITAFLGKHLRGDSDTYEPYLDILPLSNDSARADESDPSYWTGFPNYSAIGMEFHHLLPGQAAP